MFIRLQWQGLCVLLRRHWKRNVFLTRKCRRARLIATFQANSGKLFFVAHHFGICLAHGWGKKATDILHRLRYDVEKAAERHGKEEEFTGVLPVDMKKGIRNLPLRTRARKFCRVLPSNGRAPHTNTYNTTPKLYTEKRQQETNNECIIFRLSFNKQLYWLYIKS